MANRDQSAEEVFAEALELPPGERSAFLVRACRGSAELRRLVEGLLMDYQRMGDFMDQPTVAAPFDAHATADVEVEQAFFAERFPAGSKLGRYTIREPLGAGGMGAVYRARDEKLERDVAIKVLSPGLLSDEETRRRFRRETLALAKLSHSRIAAIYDVGEQDGIDFLVMECVAGETLANRLSSGPLTVKEATSILLQIAEALEDAHEQGVIHRDLKPTNVMITLKGNIKVLDFGIAKLLHPQSSDATRSILEAGMIAGTPLYMSPEQAEGKPVDPRTDLWSLGVIYFESLTARTPFTGEGAIAVLHAILNDPPPPAKQLRPDLPPLAEQIISRALAKSPASRYQSAAEMAQDGSALLAEFSTVSGQKAVASSHSSRTLLVLAMLAIVLVTGVSATIYYRFAKRRWALEQAMPRVVDLQGENLALAGFLLANQAKRYLPDNAQLQRLIEDNSTTIAVNSSPAGAKVEIQDYLTPNGAWHLLGTTPLNNLRVPQGYFRWRVSKPGVGQLLVAPETSARMDFDLAATQAAPPRMVLVPASSWGSFVAFVGWLGPYKLPPFYIDRFEVTNREFQKFVDSGGYENRQYWSQSFTADTGTLTWEQATAQFRDATGRPGPSTWTAGHYPEGEGDLPVAGVSWFEASAYASFAGKELPALSQWYAAAPTDSASYNIPLSNIEHTRAAPVGSYQGLGPFGTYDMVGNVREWVATTVDHGLHFILGGSWRSPSYIATSSESESPFDRSETNGFRCVRNLGQLPPEATSRVQRISRDFSHYKPASDVIFNAYKLLYAYPRTPLNAVSGGVVRETADWREEKISYDTGYRGERMSAYLFLPTHVRPPYQTVIFFPSARVDYIPNSGGGRELGDLQFFDYILQSGRAVMYPIYENTYERTIKFSLPSGGQDIQLTTDWYKDIARSLDYLETRADIDHSDFAYLGVSMGSAEGVIAATLLQDRLKTAIFLDGGFFLDPPPPGGDQADFAPRMKKPVLMVNGRYDYVFSVDKMQNPLFAMLGTAPQDKRHILLDTPHDVTEQRPTLVHSVLEWLDHYMGRVKS